MQKSPLMSSLKDHDIPLALEDHDVPLSAGAGPASEALAVKTAQERRDAAIKRIRSIDKGIFIAVDNSEMDAIASDLSNALWVVQQQTKHASSNNNNNHNNNNHYSPVKKRFRGALGMMKRTEKFHEFQLSQILDQEEHELLESHLPWPSCPTAKIVPQPHPHGPPPFGFAVSRRSSM